MGYCPDSGDSLSPQDSDNLVSWEDPLAAARVKLMVSYGGRIHPRADGSLAYVGGETKIVAVGRTARLPAVISKLAAALPAATADEVCFRYQLPGEDLDNLITVVDDEDLENMMHEYDRLLALVKPSPRLRLFVFRKPPDRPWFASDPSPPAAKSEGPDFLFGLDNGFVPPPTVNLKAPPVADQASESAVLEPISIEAPVRSEDPVVSPAERQIQELRSLQISVDNKQAGFQRSASEEAIYYKMTAPMTTAAQITPMFWADRRYGSTAGGDQAVYLIPASLAAGGHLQAYYAAMPAVYAMALPSKAATGSAEAAGFAAYDSSGRAVYYASALPTAAAYHQANVVGPTNTDASKAAAAAAKLPAGTAGFPQICY